MAIFGNRRSILTTKSNSITYPIDIIGGTAPLFAYSIVKLSSKYNGPSIRVLRPSDSAELDIRFDCNGKLSSTNLIAFLGAEEGQILKFYDQSGNGNDTQIQSTSGYRLLINIPEKSVIPGVPAIYGDPFTYSLPSTLATDPRAFSFYAILSQRIFKQGAIFSIGSTPSYQMYIQPDTTILNLPSAFINASTQASPNTIRTRMDPCVYEAVLSSTYSLQSQGSETFSTSAAAISSPTGGMLGNTISGGYLFSGYGAVWLGYGRTFTTLERTSARSVLESLFSTSVNSTGRILYIGDSIIAGYTGSTTARYNGYTRQSIPFLSKKVPVYNLGAGGSTFANHNSWFANGAGMILNKYTDNRIVFLQLGTNDIGSYSNTSANVITNLNSFVTTIKNTGAKCIVATILPSTNYTTIQQGYISDVNNYLKSSWQSIPADGLCDFTTQPIMSSTPTTLPYYNDGLHPTELGYSLLAPIAATAINTLL